MEFVREIFEYDTKYAVIKSDKQISEVFEIKNTKKKIEFEFGKLAKQANFAVKVTSGGTSVLCCVVMGDKENKTIPSEPLVPLIVDYRERTYATGKIPGGFFKREGKPREHEVHVSRLIDRTIRPLFPKDFNYDVQVSVLVLSFDPENDPTILSVLGTSLALSLSEIPFEGHCSCFRLCKIKDEYIVNPTFNEMELSEVDLIVSFYKDNILMIETEANKASEDEIIKMISYLQRYAILFDEFQQKIVSTYGKKKVDFEKNYDLEKLFELNYNSIKDFIKEALKIEDKKERSNKYKEIAEKIVLKNEFCKEEILKNEELITQLKERVFFTIFRDVVRKMILEEQFRIDNRKYDDIREIKCEVGVLPRTHGSALFQRGQTQALVTVTLGTLSDMQIMDELIGKYKERFMFHYNFPGFATGEIRPDKGVSRRELGHGLLAKKSLEAVLPSQEEFPYTIRIVSDILESNGSSSMASVCGATLALLDAGVKIKDSVAGVAMGLVKENENYVVLTDISGIEDHVGDMDFKVAGTKDGITAIQLDLKIAGIPLTIVRETLIKAKYAREKILSIMNLVIEKPRDEISALAPRIKVLQIPSDKIGDLIGPKGKNIKQIIEETQSKIDIDEDGNVFVSAENEEMLKKAVAKIEAFTKDVEVGKVYLGKVKKVVNYGAFIEVLPGRVGLLHVSQFADHRVNSLQNLLSEGDEVYVKVIEVDEEGRPVLSRKEAIKDGYK
jgi:polyribonucleotide nucleotidyltransferase